MTNRLNQSAELNSLTVCTLNLWCGLKGSTLGELIADLSKTVDVFCFQELLDDHPKATTMLTKSALLKVLPDWQFDYTVSEENHQVSAELLNFEPASTDRFTLFVATATRPGLYRTCDSWTVFDKLLLPDGGDAGCSFRRLLRTSIQTGKHQLSIYNYHGVWRRDPQGDYPASIYQAKAIEAIRLDDPSYQILAGDFNNNHGTKNFRIMTNGLYDPTEDYDIKTTRNANFAWTEQDPYADYVVASPELTVKSYKTIDTLASDHLPVLATYDLPQ